MKKRSTSRGPAKPAAETDCTLASHQEIARTTQFKVCPHCGEPLAAHRQYPVEPDPVTQALTSMASEDEQFFSSNIEAIRHFIRGMAGFFITARDIEAGARATLVQFNGYQQPTNLEEDEILVSRIRAARVEFKVATDHHEPVTSLFNAIHKRFVAGRKRPQDALTEAINRGDKLHNAWAEEAKRRAREKEEQERREAEARAQADRDAELAVMEEKALRAEAESEDLSAREQKFVDAVAAGYPPNTAAKVAGYGDKFVQHAQRLMGLVKINTAIEGKRKAAQIRQQASAVSRAPLQTATVETVKAEVASGTRETRSADVYDVPLFMAALLDPTQRLHYGIPAEVATFVQTKMNEQARVLDKQINRWPGVRLHTKQGVV